MLGAPWRLTYSRMVNLDLAITLLIVTPRRGNRWTARNNNRIMQF